MHRFIVILSGIFLLSQVSCTRQADQFTEVCLTTQHHDKIIPNITVYVKYNSEVFPGYEPLSQFDEELISDQNGRICKRNFPLGRHWFIGIGYDEEIREQVIGNLDIRFDLRNLQVDTILYVGEE